MAVRAALVHGNRGHAARDDRRGGCPPLACGGC